MIKERAWNGPWLQLSATVRNYPSMLTLEEKRMLRWLTANYYSGEGIICDLGAFIGGSTVSLADGLAASGRNDKLIHSYDFFRSSSRLWEKYMAQSGKPWPENGDVMNEVREMLQDYDHLITFYQGDFMQSPVPEGPIEICFVDISKTAEINDHLISKYFTKLIPGKSIVVQQDYFHFTPLWDIVTMEILKDYFTPIGYTEEYSALFLYTRELDAEGIERAHSRHFTHDQFVSNIKAASHNWPYAKQKADLYRALLAVDTAGNVTDKAWQVGHKMKSNGQQAIQPDAMYAAFAQN